MIAPTARQKINAQHDDGFIRWVGPWHLSRLGWWRDFVTRWGAVYRYAARGRNGRGGVFPLPPGAAQ